MKGEEQGWPGGVVSFEFENGFAMQQDVARRDHVVGVASNRLGERGFAGAIGPHDSVDFAAVDRERKALDDGLFADGDVQVFDFELRHGKDYGLELRVES